MIPHKDVCILQRFFSGGLLYAVIPVAFGRGMSVV